MDKRKNQCCMHKSSTIYLNFRRQCLCISAFSHVCINVVILFCLTKQCQSSGVGAAPFELMITRYSNSCVVVKTKTWEMKDISARADGGPRSPSAHAWRVRLSPHRHEQKFSGAHVRRVTFKHLPQPLRSYIRSFGTLGQLFKIPPFHPNMS